MTKLKLNRTNFDFANLSDNTTLKSPVFMRVADIFA